MSVIGTKYKSGVEIFKVRTPESEMSPEPDVSWLEYGPSEADPSESLDSDPSESETLSLSTNAFSRVNYE